MPPVPFTIPSVSQSPANARAAAVDGRLGVGVPANCLIGPYRPFGAVRPGPDSVLENARGATSGYRPGERVRHFSQIHVSGTGGGGRYGNLALMPMSETDGFTPEPQTLKDIQSWPGYFAASLEPSGTKLALTSTPNCAFYKIQFGSTQRSVMFFPGATLLMGGHCRLARIERIGEVELEGEAIFSGGWGHDQPYAFYFVVRFDQPWASYSISGEPCDKEHLATQGSDCRARIDFPQTSNVVEVRIAVSRNSLADTRRSLREEANIPFQSAVLDSEACWADAFSQFTLEGDASARAMFDAMLHRLYAMPSELGVNRGASRWHSGVRHFDDFFCLWDSCRNANSFFHLFRPALSGAMAASLIDVAEHTGWLPDAWISQHHGFIQGGCSADLVLSEAARKGVPGFDARRALDFIRKNAEADSPNQDFYGRYRTNYQQLGYVTPDETVGCASRQIEYSYHDWCTARLAEHLGQSDIAAHYETEASKIWHLWDPSRKCFFPKNADGSPVPDFDLRQPSRPIEEGHYSSDPYFFEGTALEWSLCALHVLPEIIARMGGAERFVDHLDNFFKDGIYAWKEIILHTPWLYHYAGRPDKSADALRQQLMRYRNAPDGIPDNEDMGSHSAFWLWAALGLYPVMGQCVYLITPPRFTRVVTTVGPKQQPLEITLEGPADGYIVAASWNGQPLPHAWLVHDQLAGGGILSLTLAARPQGWGQTPPPIC